MRKFDLLQSVMGGGVLYCEKVFNTNDYDFLYTIFCLYSLKLVQKTMETFCTIYFKLVLVFFSE